MDFVEKTGKTVDEAVTAALIELGVSSDQVEVDVLEDKSKGLFGLFGKNVKVRVSLKKEADTSAEAAAPAPEQKEAKASEAPKMEKKQAKTEKKNEKSEAKKDPESVIKAEAAEASAEAIAVAAEAKAEQQEPAEDEDIERTAAFFLMDVLKAMGIDAEIDTHLTDENVLEIDMEDTAEESGMGMIIGKRGATLDSLQYLTTMVINKNTSEHVRVKLDTENYRGRRQKTLENLAYNLAKKVKKTGHRVVLEPMNPYERRIIHSTLQGDRMIETHSEGEEPYRKVVISLKRRGN